MFQCREVIEQSVFVEKYVEQTLTGDLVGGIDRSLQTDDVTILQRWNEPSGQHDHAQGRLHLLPPVLLNFSLVATQSLS